MASLHSYTFDNLSRINDDACALTERDLQNQNYGSYSTTNYFSNMCGMKKPIEFATSQPNVNFKGGFGNYCGAGGCNIDEGSDLKIGSIQTKSKCRISLQTRPFASVPYLGRGPSRPVLEAKLQQGAYAGNKKSCKTVTEKAYGYDKTPLVPSLAATIQNPNNLVEGAAAEGWIRGGLPSREITRDSDYMSRKN